MNEQERKLEEKETEIFWAVGKCSTQLIICIICLWFAYNFNFKSQYTVCNSKCARWTKSIRFRCMYKSYEHDIRRPKYWTWNWKWELEYDEGTKVENKWKFWQWCRWNGKLCYKFKSKCHEKRDQKLQKKNTYTATRIQQKQYQISIIAWISVRQVVVRIIIFLARSTSSFELA